MSKRTEQRDWSRKKVIQILRYNGYRYVDCKGSHYHWYRESDGDKINLPMNKDVNPMLWRRIVKEHNLVIC